MGIKNIFPKDKIKELDRLLQSCDRIAVTCHMRPDGDAIGSSLGWYHLLKSMGKEVTVILPDRAPRSLEFLPGFHDIAIYTQHEDFVRRVLSEIDLLLMCDFNKPSRQGNLEQAVQECPAPKVLIDHHKDPDKMAGLMFSYPAMSSACELSFRLMAALGLYDRMNLDCATALLTGLITDTQNFSVNCDDPETYVVMMRLMEKNVDKTRIIREAVKSTSLNALKLNSFAITNRMEIFPEHRCALITLSADDLRKFSYEKGDTEGLVNEPLRIRGIAYSVFMREDSDCIKVSTRSIMNFPVDKICSDLFNGGGHQMAAGGEFIGSLQNCRQILLDHMQEYDQFLPKGLAKLEIK